MASAVEIVENASFGRKLSPNDLDELCERRMAIKAELDEINDAISGQVAAFGFTPTNAEKSKRLATEKYQMTLTAGDKTEIRDTQVAVIEKACPVALFERLFVKTTKYKLKNGATLLLANTLPAGAPSNLRKMFAAAVQLKRKQPSLSIKPLGEADEYEGEGEV